MVAYTLSDIAGRLGGTVLGDGATLIRQVATLERAAPDTISFLANERYLGFLKTTRAGAVIVGEAFRSAVDLPRIVTDNPYAYFARVSALLNPAPPVAAGRHASAVIDPGAQIASSASIGPGAVVEAGARIGEAAVVGAGCFIGARAVIGARCRLHPRVTIYHDCVIGDDALIHSGAVIGADGFGIAMDQGRWLKVPQIGAVRIGRDVEIGANTTIDRGAIEDTVIGDGVKLDNQIQIAHNVEIGAHTAIAACVGIAGSSRIGAYCRIGGASGIAGHLSIADHVEISAHTLVTKSITEPGTYTGAYPFEPNRDWRRNAASLRRLGDLGDRVRALEKALDTKTKGQ
jgi:UDP-3-O-[3-hydroxymyristoyl] glucosamine N-acyltransferase